MSLLDGPGLRERKSYELAKLRQEPRLLAGCRFMKASRTSVDWQSPSERSHLLHMELFRPPDALLENNHQ